MKQIETEILINVSPAKVWEVLTRFDNFPTWNPFIKSVAGKKAAGEKLKVTIQLPNRPAMVLRPVVLVYKKEKELRWKGKLGIEGIFDGEHYFMLEAVAKGRTKFIHGEIFKGILVPFMGRVLKETTEGFKLMNESLKAKCEKSPKKIILVKKTQKKKV